MPTINFEAKLAKIDSQTIVHLPPSASAKLPSRGMVMVQGTINGAVFQAPLEPDGKKGHLLKLDEKLLKATKAQAGDKLSLAIEPSKEWPEPVIPADLAAALQADQTAQEVWKDITPMARWDWIRWISGTKNVVTRQRRIEVALSKMNAGSRRPCCFNRAECTDPSISKNGVLLGLV